LLAEHPNAAIRDLFPGNPNVGKSWGDICTNIPAMFTKATIGPIFKALGKMKGGIPVLY
jgi:hypothetical protein